MGAHVEVWGDGPPSVVRLEADHLTAGSDPSNEIALRDPAVSRMHVALQRYAAGWAVRDMASRNGTFVNGERVLGERPLRPGDEIKVGNTRLVFRDTLSAGAPATATVEPAPELTRREREILLALCRPVMSGDLFTGPSSLRDMAAELFVSENAVKQHLHRLYRKFGVTGEGDRRARLANEALRRGAVSLADLRKKAGEQT